jgi:hypothetical protein
MRWRIVAAAVCLFHCARRAIVRRRSSARIRSPTTRTSMRLSVPNVRTASSDRELHPARVPELGPNFWKFDDNVLYEIMVDNTGDAVEDLTYQFRFNTSVSNPNTFLYNTVRSRRSTIRT